MCLKSQAQLDGTQGLAVASCRLQLVRSQGFLLGFSLISFKSHIFQTCIWFNLVNLVNLVLVFELSLRRIPFKVRAIRAKIIIIIYVKPRQNAKLKASAIVFSTNAKRPF